MYLPPNSKQPQNRGFLRSLLGGLGGLYNRFDDWAMDGYLPGGADNPDQRIRNKKNASLKKPRMGLDPDEGGPSIEDKRAGLMGDDEAAAATAATATPLDPPAEATPAAQRTPRADSQTGAMVAQGIEQGMGAQSGGGDLMAMAAERGLLNGQGPIAPQGPVDRYRATLDQTQMPNMPIPPQTASFNQQIAESQSMGSVQPRPAPQQAQQMQRPTGQLAAQPSSFSAAAAARNAQIQAPPYPPEASQAPFIPSAQDRAMNERLQPSNITRPSAATQPEEIVTVLAGIANGAPITQEMIDQVRGLLDQGIPLEQAARIASGGG